MPPRASWALPLVEDNPYGDLWFDAPPPPPLTARNPEGCIYLGSFSKVLAPGLRLGYLVAPKASCAQAAAGQAGGRPAQPRLQPAHGRRGDARRLPRPARAHHPRALQGAARRDAGRAGTRDAGPARALEHARGRHVPVGAAARRRRRDRPAAQGGGARAWPSCRARRSTPARPTARTLRLSFVTASAEQIDTGIAALAAPSARTCGACHAARSGAASSINVRKVVLPQLDCRSSASMPAQLRHRQDTGVPARNPNALVRLEDDASTSGSRT